MTLQKKHNVVNIFPVTIFVRKLLAGISIPKIKSLTFLNLIRGPYVKSERDIAIENFKGYVLFF